MTECFLIEPTGDCWIVAKVFEGEHEAERVLVEREPIVYEERPSGYRGMANGPDWGDVDWPTTCDDCGESFTDEAHSTMARRRWWRNVETGEEERSAHDFGPGAMWNADWMPSADRSEDGRYLVVIAPDGHEWAIDSSASNCTRPGEDHDCWCRHGEPPNITVDKNPEPGRTTCTAGAGSIGTPGYHGFLRGGKFT